MYKALIVCEAQLSLAQGHGIAKYGLSSIHDIGNWL